MSTTTRSRDRTRRRELRAARRAQDSGSGPASEGWDPGANPGARGAFALFGEVLVTGVLVSLVGLLVVTLPVGLAAGVRHLRRFVAAEDASMRLFWEDVRRAALPGTGVGIGAVLLGLLLLLDIDLARSGFLPGGALVEVIGWVGLAALAVALLAAAGRWTPERGWLSALRQLPGLVRDDVAGAAYLLATAGFVVVLTWALTPLVVPALGCAALAVVAVPGRPRRAAR
ncbi:hypothetical protein [Tessaracoccus rhinocerotis]|uniref:hypothetical protein n=1 Tax=Tessaracoccus rhinocerotis TaxID=1689449 RepID=UPI001C8F6593|nr:hypothetical protein [Tessaracoccus rhinocerotis]